MFTDTAKENSLKDSIDEFTTSDRASIKCMFIAIGDLESKPMTKDITKDRPMFQVSNWLKKEHRLDKTKNLNVFISDSYIPRPNQSLFDLHQKHSNSDGIMVIKYSTQVVYG